MADTHEEPAICPHCGALAIIRWEHFTDVLDVEIDVDGETIRVDLTAYSAAPIEPCNHPEQT